MTACTDYDPPREHHWGPWRKSASGRTKARACHDCGTVDVWKRRVVARPEEDLQRAIVSILLYCRPQLDGRPVAWFAVPNESKQKSRRKGGIRKAMGVRAGVADLCFFNVGVIELKASSRRLSPAQEAFRDECFEAEVNWALCRSLDEVLYTLRAWGVTFAIEPVFT